VRILADMADLRPVVIDNLVYVTSKKNAKKLEAEEATRKAAKSKSEVEDLPKHN